MYTQRAKVATYLNKYKEQWLLKYFHQFYAHNCGIRSSSEGGEITKKEVINGIKPLSQIRCMYNLTCTYHADPVCETCAL